MSLNSRSDRASAIGIAFPALNVLPAPSGSIDRAARQQLGYSYAGIVALGLPITQWEGTPTVDPADASLWAGAPSASGSTDLWDGSPASDAADDTLWD